MNLKLSVMRGLSAICVASVSLLKSGLHIYDIAKTAGSVGELFKYYYSTGLNSFGAILTGLTSPVLFKESQYQLKNYYKK